MPLVPRIIAAMAAVAVLAMGTDCACAGGNNPGPLARALPAGDRAVMPCCARHGAAHHCKLRERDHRSPNPCGGACEHCGQSVMNDTLPATANAPSQASWVRVPSPALAFAGVPFSAAHPLCVGSIGDLPPPLTSVTLLGLHCALIG